MKEKGKRILICDDDAEFLTVVAESLKAQHYEPITVETGKECVEKCAQFSPDLVLLDYRLPDVDGKEVLEDLRRAGHELPIILMTGFGDQKLAAEVIKSGAMDYLVKPLHTGELSESIRNTLRRADRIKARREREKLILWGKLLPQMAHEIRTPLHSIDGALTLIRSRHKNDKTTVRALQIIHEEIVRLNEFVNQCLDFSRSPSKESFKLTNLNQEVSACLQLMASFFTAAVKKLQLKTKLDDSLPPVYVNREEIKQVLINLLRNAVEAIPKEGMITVETHHERGKPGGFAEIKVIDNGVGVREEDLADVFTPFFSRKGGGTGLGLAICKKIIEENHHGQIGIESRLSKGTTITVTLPIGPSPGYS